jgi:hypothetical protein
VLARYRELGRRGGAGHQIPDQQRAWAAQVIAVAEAQGAVEVPTAAYVSWHVKGQQVLRLASTPRRLTVHAGVQHKARLAGPRHLKLTLAAAIDAEQLSACRDVITFDSTHDEGRAQGADPAEHRLQAAIARQQPKPYVHTELKREYPGWRAPLRPGFIDFLGRDPNNELRIVETKIGHDACVLLQALDYAIWLQANEDAVRDRLGWPTKPARGRLHLDLVLAPKVRTGKRTEPAVNAYLPAQIEALAGDIKVRVLFVDDVDPDRLELRELTADQLWQPVDGVVAKSLRPQRWAARVAATLRSPSSRKSHS